MIYVSWNLSHFGTKRLINSIFLSILSLKNFSVKTAGFYITVVKRKLLNQEYFLQFDCI